MKNLLKYKIFLKLTTIIIVSAIFLFHTPEAKAASYKSIAKKFFSKKNYPKAKDYFEKIVETDPKDSESWFYLGYIAEQDKEHDKAVEYYKKALEGRWLKKEIYKIVLWKLIIYHKQKNQFAQTYHYAQIFLSKYPRTSAIQKIVKQITAEKMWTLSPEAESFYLKGIEQLKQNNSQEAASFFRQAISYDPSFVAPKVKLGVLYHGAGNTSDALQVFREVLEGAPFYGIAHFYIGLIYEKENNCTQALDKFDEAEKYLATNREYIYFHIPYRKGRCYLKLKKFDEALTHFRKALKRRSKNIKLLLLLGITEEKRNNLTKSERYFRTVIRHVKHPEAFYRLYKLAHRRERKKEQIKWAKNLTKQSMTAQTIESIENLDLARISSRYLPMIILATFYNSKDKRIPYPILEKFKDSSLPWNDDSLKPFSNVSLAFINFQIGIHFFEQSDYDNALSSLYLSPIPKASYLTAKIYSHQQNWDKALEYIERAIQGEKDFAKKATNDPIFFPLQQRDRFLFITGQINEEEYNKRTKVTQNIENQNRENKDSTETQTDGNEKEKNELKEQPEKPKSEEKNLSKEEQ